jgi:hypothetical protein
MKTCYPDQNRVPKPGSPQEGKTMFLISAYSQLLKSIAVTMLVAGLSAAQSLTPLDQSALRQFRQIMSSPRSATSIKLRHARG